MQYVEDKASFNAQISPRCVGLLNEAFITRDPSVRDRLSRQIVANYFVNKDTRSQALVHALILKASQLYQLPDNDHEYLALVVRSISSAIQIDTLQEEFLNYLELAVLNKNSANWSAEWKQKLWIPGRPESVEVRNHVLGALLFSKFIGSLYYNGAIKQHAFEKAFIDTIEDSYCVEQLTAVGNVIGQAGTPYWKWVERKSRGVDQFKSIADGFKCQLSGAGQQVQSSGNRSMLNRKWLIKETFPASPNAKEIVKHVFDMVDSFTGGRGGGAGTPGTDSQDSTRDYLSSW